MGSDLSTARTVLPGARSVAVARIEAPRTGLPRVAPKLISKKSDAERAEPKNTGLWGTISGAAGVVTVSGAVDAAVAAWVRGANVVAADESVVGAVLVVPVGREVAVAGAVAVATVVAVDFNVPVVVLTVVVVTLGAVNLPPSVVGDELVASVVVVRDVATVVVVPVVGAPVVVADTVGVTTKTTVPRPPAPPFAVLAPPANAFAHPAPAPPPLPLPGCASEPSLV
ncbi:MAG: hypothetical protein FJW81_10985 [Actinobacteria bacterium]|nr:hypothetical protein [Actinomycetota bacterium]